MAGKDQYTAEQFIKALEGSGGIISTVAKRVGCRWETAKKYIDSHPTVKAVYKDEREKNLDRSEAVVFGNISLAAKQVDAGMIADSSDAKWVLSRLGKHRGYGDKQEVDVTSGGKPLPFREIVVEKSNEDLAD